MHIRDFVQRNGQNSTPLELLNSPDDDDEHLEPEQSGSSEAIVVRVPKTISKREILS